MAVLLDGQLVARVDLKADRAANTCMWWVPSASRVAAARVAEALAGELESMAPWLGLARVTVGKRGDLAGALRAQGR